MDHDEYLKKYAEETERQFEAEADRIREQWLRSKQNRPDEHEGRSEND